MDVIIKHPKREGKIQKVSRNITRIRMNGKKLSERGYKRWAVPGEREKQSIRMSKVCNQPTYLKNLHAGHKRFHDNLTPEQTLKRLRKSMFKGCISPNKSEKQIGKIVEYHPFHFKFTGGIRNPEHAIAGYFVDWTWVEINAAMDYHGPGGHDPSVPWVSENQAELDNIRSQRIRDAGWNYCILTEEDRQDIDKLILKITDFVEKCKRSDS